MKAYALVGAEHAPLRRSLLEFPWPRLYEHPWMNCALAIERNLSGRRGGLRRNLPSTRAADAQPASAGRGLVQERDAGKGRLLPDGAAIQPGTDADSPAPLVGHPQYLGLKRSKRFGTFGLSSYGALGAEQIHPISPLTTTLTYGPIDPVTGKVIVKLIYDHRVLDGAYVARRLRDIEEVLNGPILDELRDGGATSRDRRPTRRLNVEPLLKPHLPARRPRAERARRTKRRVETRLFDRTIPDHPVRLSPRLRLTSPIRRPPGRS